MHKFEDRESSLYNMNELVNIKNQKSIFQIVFLVNRRFEYRL